MERCYDAAVGLLSKRYFWLKGEANAEQRLDGSRARHSAMRLNTDMFTPMTATLLCILSYLQINKNNKLLISGYSGKDRLAINAR